MTVSIKRPKVPDVPSNASAPVCPVGESQCQVIDEVAQLREEVSQLAQQVRTDTLTGLYNYHHLQQVLAQEMERSRRTGQPTALVMVDLDYFKQVNDRYGHEVGNRALQSTAQVLQHVTRQLDIPCRYGGEEFSVVLPSTDMLTAIQVAERIRQAIETQPVMVDDEDIGLTASIGVDAYQAQQDETPEQFIQRADACLYRAKQAGRNRVCHGEGAERPASAVSTEERHMLADLFGDSDD